jgi:hypothetical protein
LKLSGWQRLGIVLSLAWALYRVVMIPTELNREVLASANVAYDICDRFRDQSTAVPKPDCMVPWREAYFSEQHNQSEAHV